MVYVGLCVLMLFLSQPQSEIEPVGISRDQRLLMSGGRVPKSVSPLRGEHLSHMTTLLRSHMFTEQGIKLKWIKERIARQEEYIRLFFDVILSLREKVQWLLCL